MQNDSSLVAAHGKAVKPKRKKAEKPSAYAEKLKDPRWQRKRLEVMGRDGFRCRDCKSPDKTLHVHHCHYEKGPPWETPAKYLLTLCWECHEWRQNFEDMARRNIGELMATIDLHSVASLSHSATRAVEEGIDWPMITHVVVVYEGEMALKKK